MYEVYFSFKNNLFFYFVHLNEQCPFISIYIRLGFIIIISFIHNVKSLKLKCARLVNVDLSILPYRLLHFNREN